MPIIIILRYFLHSKQSLNGTRLNQGISPRLLQPSSFIPAHRSLVVYNGPPIIDTRPLHRFHPSYSWPQANSQREIANNRILEKSHTLLCNNCRNQINLTKKRCSKVSLPFTNPVQSISYSYKTLPKAQRTRGLSSSCQSNLLKSYHKFKHKSWSHFIFKISTISIN